MRQDLLVDMFCTIKNAEALGKLECMVPVSKLIKDVLSVMESDGYIGSSEHVEDSRGGKLRVKLIQRINNTKGIKPRFYVEAREVAKYEKRFLPAVGMGILIISTSRGVMDQNKARDEGIGGSLLGYVY